MPGRKEKFKMLNTEKYQSKHKIPVKNFRKSTNKSWREKKNYLSWDNDYLYHFYNDMDFYYPLKKRGRPWFHTITTKRLLSKYKVEWWENLTFQELVDFCLKLKQSRKRTKREEVGRSWRKFVMKNELYRIKKVTKDIYPKIPKNPPLHTLFFDVNIEKPRRSNYSGVMLQKQIDTSMFIDTW